MGRIWMWAMYRVIIVRSSKVGRWLLGGKITKRVRAACRKPGPRGQKAYLYSKEPSHEEHRVSTRCPIAAVSLQTLGYSIFSI